MAGNARPTSGPVKLAEQLSYRQLCLIVILVNKDEFNIPKVRSQRGGSLTITKAALLQELYDLYSQGVVDAEGGGYWFKFTELNPGGVKVHGTGGQLYYLMELNYIDRTDLNEIASLLR